jgi:hypothetical protein
LPQVRKQKAMLQGDFIDLCGEGSTAAAATGGVAAGAAPNAPLNDQQVCSRKENRQAYKAVLHPLHTTTPSTRMTKT